MVAGFLIAVSAGAFWTLSGIANSLCARYKLSIITYLFSNVLCSFLLSVFFCVRYHSMTLDSVISLAPILIPSGILNTSGAFLLQYAMKSGHHGIVFLLSQSAMIIPFLFGILLSMDGRESVLSPKVGIIDIPVVMDAMWKFLQVKPV